jgi:hypothetical protein
MKDLQLTRLLHDNMATVMTFVFSQAPIRRMIEEQFSPQTNGYPERLADFSFEVPSRNAKRACLEIAVLFRLIDEQYKGPEVHALIPSEFEALKTKDSTRPIPCRSLSDHLKQVNPDLWSSFGVQYRTNGTTKPLTLKQLTNKIIHADDLSWDLSDEKAPKLICTASDDQQKQYGWVRAEVDIVSLASFCDGFLPG